MSDELAMTDLGNAELLAEIHGKDLRYCRYGRKDSGTWFVWRDTNWVPDDSGEVWRRAAETVRRLYIIAAEHPNQKQRAELAKWAASSESDHRLKAMVNLARNQMPIPITPIEFDADGWVLNCINGVVDLRSGQLREHRREDYLTHLSPVAYDPEAQAPRWRQHLLEIFDGNEHLAAFLQRLAGVWLTADISEHLLPIAYGAGRNGKSVTLEAIMGVMGTYAADAPPNLLTTKRNDEHPTELADLLGKRLVVASETDEGRYLRVALVKKLTGDRYIKARFMRQDFFQFARTHKTILITNNRPIIRERSAAIWERVLEIPFKISFVGREDKHLPDKLKAEFPGILRWMVDGCLAWQRDGIGIPQEVKAATQEYQAEQDTVSPFIEEECIRGAGKEVTRAAIWGRYLDWSKRAGERPMHRNNFYARLREEGFEDAKVGSGSVRGFKGIGLLTRENTDQPDSRTPSDTHLGVNAHERADRDIPKTGVRDCPAVQNEPEEEFNFGDNGNGWPDEEPVEQEASWTR